LSGRGRFITLEGGEAVGKSTLARRLHARLAELSVEAVLTREPGGAPGAEALRRLLLQPPDGVVWSPLAEALLFSAARVDHLANTIEPALAAGRWVICDRFADSTRAYQAASHPEMVESISALERIAVGSRRPDLTVILDLPVEMARERLRARGGDPDSFEQRSLGFHEAVRQRFLDIAREEPERCVVLDAATDPDELARQTLAAATQRWGQIP
jgi:dTMP kinase